MLFKEGLSVSVMSRGLSDVEEFVYHTSSSKNRKHTQSPSERLLSGIVFLN